jgi:hypothetical protein
MVLVPVRELVLPLMLLPNAATGFNKGVLVRVQVLGELVKAWGVVWEGKVEVVRRRCQGRCCCQG